jgi:thiol-disulfide isomerase/thioredoxin
MRFLKGSVSYLKRLVPFFIVAILGAAGMWAAASPSPDLPDNGAAPELTNTVWLNADHPLRLSDYRGQVIVLDFWTVNCSNCYHTLPYLKGVYTRLNGRGLQVISIHFPEFSYEADVNYVSDYLKQNDIRYPVAIDNDGATWNAYEMHAWPALELIDKNGHRRFRIIGEKHYDTIEAAIQELLAEPDSAANWQSVTHNRIW